MTEIKLASGRTVKWAVAPAGRSRNAAGKQREQINIHYDSLSDENGIIPVSDAETLEATKAINEAIHGPQPEEITS